MRATLHLKRHVTIDATKLREWVRQQVAKYFVDAGMNLPHENFSHYCEDTANRVWQYLTTDGARGADGRASDVQCSLCIQAREAFGVPRGRNVTVCIG